MRRVHRAFPVLALVAALLCSGGFAEAAEPDEPEETRSGILRGKVFDKDGKNPLAGVGVRAVHAETGEVIEGTWSGPYGKYEITGLPSGYYDLVFVAGSGTFLATQLFFVPPGGTVTASFALTPVEPGERGWWEGSEPRIPGTDRVPDGRARLLDTDDKGSFLKTGKGKALLIGGGALLVGVLVSGGDPPPDKKGVSQSTP
jgi:hypothetical protein